MEDKIKKLYKFLKENRQYNKQVQEGFIKSCIAIDGLTTEQKVLNLLYGVVNTQSQPKMNAIGEFFKKIYENKSKLATYNGFLEAINQNKVKYTNLYELLRLCPGWGQKTAALFVKYIYIIHKDDTFKTSRIWTDFSLNENELKLPVDSVITHIFKNSFLQEKKQSTFVGINKFISNLPSENSNVIIWDELWFWGFITQQNQKNLKSQKMERKNIKLNVNKFLCLPYVEKDIFEIEKLANEFFGMIKPITNE
jgi:hypothetical protein